MTTPAPVSPAHAGKYLTVVLAGECYGIPVLKVREIIRVPTITAVPQLPAFVRGVINLRGRVVPITDLRVKFGFDAVVTERTCIVVVEVKLPSGRTRPMGVIVDSVEEVVPFTPADIAATPDFGTAVHPDYILGLAQAGQRVSLLLDIDCALSGETSRIVEAAT